MMLRTNTLPQRYIHCIARNRYMVNPEEAFREMKVPRLIGAWVERVDGWRVASDILDIPEGSHPYPVSPSFSWQAEACAAHRHLLEDHNMTWVMCECFVVQSEKHAERSHLESQWNVQNRM